MPDLSPQQVQALQEWLDSLPWPRRWAVKAGLIAGGYMDWTGHLKPFALGPLGCLIIVVIALIIIIWWVFR